MMKKIRIAQIGTSCNSHGHPVFRTLTECPDIFEIVGYALPENEREKFPDQVKVFDAYKEMTVEEILADESIDAVTVETEEIYLTKYAKMVVDAKKHLHMEKPGGLSLPDFIEMVDVAEKNQTVFHTGYMYRYNPVILSLLERIDKGELGNIVSVEAQMSCAHPDPFREWQNTFPGCGMLFFLGCHLIDLVYRIQGEPQAVHTFVKESGKNGVMAPDYALSVLEYENGASFVKTTDVECGGFLRRQLVVTGTKETVVLEPLEKIFEGDLLTTGYRSITDESWSADGERLVSKPYHRYKDMMLGFASFVRGEKKNPYDYTYEKNLYRLVHKCCGLSK